MGRFLTRNDCYNVNTTVFPTWRGDMRLASAGEVNYTQSDEQYATVDDFDNAGKTFGTNEYFFTGVSISSTVHLFVTATYTRTITSDMPMPSGYVTIYNMAAPNNTVNIYGIYGYNGNPEIYNVLPYNVLPGIYKVTLIHTSYYTLDHILVNNVSVALNGKFTATSGNISVVFPYSTADTDRQYKTEIKNGHI